jgi:hypothetical protein
MGDALRRLSPSLRALGFNCRSNDKTSGAIIWEISPIAHKLLNPCPSSLESPEDDFDFNQIESVHETDSGHENHSFDEEDESEDLPF